MQIRVIFIAVLLVAASTVEAQSLCPPEKFSTEGAPELQMTERSFTERAALDSLSWLEKDFMAVLKRHKTTNDLLNNTEGFGIPYPNAVAIAKGTVLRLRALLTQTRLENEYLKLKAGTKDAKEVQVTQAQFTAARKEFCEFLHNAQFVD